VDEPVTLLILPHAVFIADFDELKIKRGWMATPRPQLTPGGIGRAIGILDNVKEIGHDPTHFFHRHVFGQPVQTALSGESDKHRLCLQILAELQILVKAHAGRPAVVPRIPSLGSLLDGPYGEFPVVGRLDIAAFDNTSTWESNKAGLQLGNHLRNVSTQAIWTVLASFSIYNFQLAIGNPQW